MKLYRAFILPHFYYCSSEWHFCGAHNADKVDNLNKRILRIILQDYSSPYGILLGKVNMKSLFMRLLQNFMITLYKSFFFYELSRLLKRYVHRTVFILQFAWKSYPGPSNPKTTTYGLHSFSYLASKIWNSLPDIYRTLNFLEFKQVILRYEAFLQ